MVVFEAELWIWDARRTESWTFVSVPEEISADIRALTSGPRRGFGSVRVEVILGGSTWRTSIFPGSDGGYVLPVKKAIRKAEGLDEGDTAKVSLALIDF